MDWFFLLMSLILGMFLASFYNVVAIRLPQKKTLAGRSECPSCFKTLKTIDIIPLIGFIVNRGKCRFCQTKIPIRYVVVEILGGLSFALALFMIGLSWEYLAFFLVFSVLFLEALIDYEKKIVIDRIWMIGLVPLLILRIFQGVFLQHLLSSSILFGTMFSISWIAGKIMKRDALGGGDVKLYIFIGFALTWLPGLLSIFFASLFGFMYGIIRRDKSEREIAFVPFIALGVIVSFLFGEIIIETYLNWVGL